MSAKGKTAEQVLKAQLRKAKSELRREGKLNAKLSGLKARIEKAQDQTKRAKENRESIEREVLGIPTVPREPPALSSDPVADLIRQGYEPAPRSHRWEGTALETLGDERA